MPDACHHYDGGCVHGAAHRVICLYQTHRPRFGEIRAVQRSVIVCHDDYGGSPRVIHEVRDLLCFLRDYHDYHGCHDYRGYHDGRYGRGDY